MATPTDLPELTTSETSDLDSHATGEVDRRRRAIGAAFAFGLGPLAGGCIAFSRMVPSTADPEWTQVASALNAVGATLVLIAAAALMVNMAVRFRHPKAQVLTLLDATVASLGGWGAVFLALAVLDADHVIGVLVAAAIGWVVLLIALFASRDHWG